MTSRFTMSPSFMHGFAHTCFERGVTEDDACHLIKAANPSQTFYGRIRDTLVKIAAGPGAPSSAPVASVKPAAPASPSTMPVTGLNQKATTAPIPPPSAPAAAPAPTAVTPVSKADRPLPTSPAVANAQAWEDWGANPAVAPPIGLKDSNGNQVTGTNQWSTPGGGQVSATGTDQAGHVAARSLTSPYGGGSSVTPPASDLVGRKPGVFTDIVDGKPVKIPFNTFRDMRDDGKWSEMLRANPALAAETPLLAGNTHLADGSINPAGEAMQRSLRFKTLQDMQPQPGPALASVPTAAPPAVPKVLPKVPAPALAALTPKPPVPQPPATPLNKVKLSPEEMAQYQKDKGRPYSALPPLPGSSSSSVGFVPTTQQIL